MAAVIKEVLLRHRAEVAAVRSDAAAEIRGAVAAVNVRSNRHNDNKLSNSGKLSVNSKHSNGRRSVNSSSRPSVSSKHSSGRRNVNSSRSNVNSSRLSSGRHVSSRLSNGRLNVNSAMPHVSKCNSSVFGSSRHRGHSVMRIVSRRRNSVNGNSAFTRSLNRISTSTAIMDSTGESRLSKQNGNVTS